MFLLLYRSIVFIKFENYQKLFYLHVIILYFEYDDFLT